MSDVRISRARVAGCVGILVLIAAWGLPPGEVAGVPFARHMLVHVAVLGVAAPLIALRLAGILPGQPLPLLSPLPAAALCFATVWLWHVPLLHGLAGISRVAWALEQLSFLGAGLLLWTASLRAARPGEKGAGILALLLTSMHILLLGALLTLAPRPLYTQGIHTLGDVYAQLAGQQLGGMVLLLGGGLPFLAGGLWRLVRVLNPPGAPAIGATPGEAR